MIRNPDGSLVLQSLDEMLTGEDCALWLNMEVETLLDNVRLNRIPVVKINQRVLRFHPRSILLALGVSRESMSTPMPVSPSKP